MNFKNVILLIPVEFQINNIVFIVSIRWWGYIGSRPSTPAADTQQGRLQGATPGPTPRRGRQ